jgi:AcrR family transcriptional regulator
LGEEKTCLDAPAAMLNVLRSFQLWPWPPLSATRRRAILEATIRVVGRNGYRQASVEEIVAEVGVSRATFDRYFEDKHDCFLAAYDMLVERLFAEVEDGCDEGLAWRERVETGLATVLERFAADAAFARTAVVEAAAVGAEARRRQWDTLTRFGRYLEDGRALAGERELPETIALMSAGAVSGVIFEELLAGRAETLPALLPDLLFAMLVPFVGPRAAAGEMRRVAEAY